MTSSATKQYTVVAKITGVFGVKGWVKVHSYTTPVEALSDYSNWYIKSPAGWTLLDVEQQRWQGGKLVALVRNCYDRDEAKVYCGRELAVEEAQLPVLEDGDYYWRQLEGLLAYSVGEQAGQQRQLLGKVDKLFETGANDVLVIKACEGSIDKRERLVPYLPERVVLDIDLAKNEMMLDWDPAF